MKKKYNVECPNCHNRSEVMVSTSDDDPQETVRIRCLNCDEYFDLKLDKAEESK